jgi:hypothetical protein
MMTTTTTDVIADTPSVNAPDSALRALDKLVGTWSVTGPGHHGTVTYRWMDGGHFLIQDVNLIQVRPPRASSTSASTRTPDASPRISSAAAATSWSTCTSLSTTS